MTSVNCNEDVNACVVCLEINVYLVQSVISQPIILKHVHNYLQHSHNNWNDKEDDQAIEILANSIESAIGVRDTAPGGNNSAAVKH